MDLLTILVLNTIFLFVIFLVLLIVTAMVRSRPYRTSRRVQTVRSDIQRIREQVEKDANEPNTTEVAKL